MSATRVKALGVTTRCASLEQFVAMFHPFCDERSFFVATLNMRAVGLETPFAIQLADRTPVLRGMCVVLDAWPTSANPYRRPGIRLGFRRLTADSQVAMRLLQHARTATPVDPNAVAPAEAPSETPVPIPLPPTQTAKIPPIPAAAFRRATTAGVGPRTMTITVPPKTPTIEIAVIEPPKPPVEERTPGSELVLPANPLQNLTDESLEGFVDCTLYEETGSFFRAIDDGTAVDDDPGAEPIPANPLAGVIESFAPPPPVEPPVEPPVVAVVDPPTLPLIVPPPPLPPPPPAPIYANDAMERLTPIPAGEAFSPRPASPRLSSSQRWWLAGVATAAVSLVAVVVVATRSSSSTSSDVPAPPPAEHARVAPPPPSSPTPTPSPPAPKPVAVADPKPPAPPPSEEAHTDGMPVVGDGPCKLDVTSTPAGSMIAFDGRTLGPSPLTLAGTCESHKLELSHPRYKTEQRAVAMTAGKAASLDVTLVRPTHALHVFTTPAGANVYISGRAAGTSPTVVQVMGFSGLDVMVERAGYAPVTTHVYSKVPNDQLVVNLQAIKKR